MKALANTEAKVVIMHNDELILYNPVSHVIFNVTDIEEMVSDIITYGGE